MERADLRLLRPRGGVALLVLDNPERRNAMSDAMTASWVAAIDELVADEQVRCVVITGAGTAFTSGGDTAWLAAMGEGSVGEIRQRMLAFYRAWLSIRRLEVPTIAAINGPAIGAGLCLAMACDLRVSARGARMGAPFVKLGLHPGMAGTYLLPEAIGAAAARDLLLTGRLVQDEEALRLGLVSRVLEVEGFTEAALDIAAEIAATAPLASRLTKRALATPHLDLDAALDWEGLAQPLTLASEDLQEGLRAAAERRPARFVGR